MKYLRIIFATLLLLSFLTTPMVEAAKKLTAKASVNVRVNKHGQKVDLTKAPGYRAAVIDFYAKRFGPAAQKFEYLDAHGFCCDMVHYYIAQCYHQTNQLQLAQMHYSWVSQYSKDPMLRYYSQSANQQLAYYGDHRTYSGQGNYFQKTAAGRGGGGGGGGFG